MGLAFMCGVTRRGPGWVLQLVSMARIWNAGGNCTTWGFDTPATRRWKASCSANPPGRATMWAFAGGEEAATDCVRRVSWSHPRRAVSAARTCATSSSG